MLLNLSFAARRAIVAFVVVALAGIAQPTPAVARSAPVEIIRVRCDRELVDVRNMTDGDRDLSGWVIHDHGGTSFTFPDGYVLPAGRIVRIWSGGGSGGPYRELAWTRRHIWNQDGDRATLRRPDGRRVDQRTCVDAGGPA